MRTLLFLLCFLVSLTTFGQVKKIELTFPDDGQWHYKYPKNGTIHRINHGTGIIEVLNEKGEVIETIYPPELD